MLHVPAAPHVDPEGQHHSPFIADEQSTAPASLQHSAAVGVTGSVSHAPSWGPEVAGEDPLGQHA